VRDRWLAWVPALLLAGLAAMTWWLDNTVQPVSRNPASRNDPDFVVDRFEATRMNPDGTQRYAVIANKMVHYAGDDSAVLDQPKLIHYSAEKGPMSIRANQGVLANNGENAHFSGDVQVKRQANADNAEMALYTSYLEVIPDKDLAKTDREVTLVRGDSTLKSVGLEFNNKTREMRLLSHVNGQFETPAKDRQPLPWRNRR
jgi:lipopolysaccharide export system protein LptC